MFYTSMTVNISKSKATLMFVKGLWLMVVMLKKLEQGTFYSIFINNLTDFEDIFCFSFILELFDKVRVCI